MVDWLGIGRDMLLCSLAVGAVTVVIGLWLWNRMGDDN